jgi:hypothetical protein
MTLNLLDMPKGLATFTPPPPEPPPLSPPPSIYTQRPDLNPQSLQTLDVAVELNLAYQSAKSLLEQAQYDENTPLNQKAQVVNSLNAILASITKSRSEIYNAERNRAMESALINTLKKHPTLQKAFMDDYKIALEKLK